MEIKSNRSNLHSLFFVQMGMLLFLFVFQACNNQTDSEKLSDFMDQAEEFRDRDDSSENEGEERFWRESMEDHQEEYDFWKELKNDFDAEVSRENLELHDQITYDSFFRSLENEVREFEYQSYLIPINHEGGFYNRLMWIQNSTELDSLEHYENYIERLNSIPTYFDQHIERMRRGIETGYTLPKVIFVEGYEEYITTHIYEDPTETGFYEPFKEFPEAVPEDEWERLRKEARQTITGQVMPAYQSFVNFLQDEYIPNARETIGTTDLPNGEEYYNYLVEYHTTLPLTAEEVHQTGLDEVERIRREMEAIIEDVEFEGSFTEFLEFLRTDSRFFVTEPEDLLKEASRYAKRIDGKLPELFHIRSLPKRPYGVEPVPDHLAPRYTGGRYSLGGGKRAGEYWVNTYNLPSRTLYTLEALTHHEAVPGHHLQIALHQEMEDLPRRAGGLTAYTEGWALYAERLGLDMGFYENPYSNFGRLTYEMWRACRLVVDTGMHAFGWTRQEAIDYMTQNTALSHHEIDTEINRYIAVPGQALAYKTGELKIRELRELAEKELGSSFDIRDFHEAVLKNGPVMLTVLEQQIKDFISEKKESE